MCRTMLVESEQKWIVEYIRSCPGAHRPLVRTSTFACTRSSVVTPTISCKNLHTHRINKIERMVQSFAYTLLTLRTYVLLKNGEGGVGQTVAAPMASWGEEAARLAWGRVPCGLHQL